MQHQETKIQKTFLHMVRSLNLQYKFLLVILIFSGASYGASIRKTKITGQDELYFVDIIREDDVNKMLVKATSVPNTVSQFVFNKFLNGASSSMNINGSVTPVTFTVTGDLLKKTIIREIKFTSFDGAIKIDKFLGNNSALTNGIIVRITVGGVSQDFLPIQTTQDFDGHFAFGSGARFDIITASGNDSMVAQFSPREPLVLAANSPDKIEIIIQDNLLQIAYLEAVVFGFYDD